MAEVFKAKSFGVEGFEKVIAIKRILPSMGEDRDFIKMFIDEAKIAGQLAHANICQIFELGRTDGAHFIAMEYIWGKDLLQIQNRLKKLGQPMPINMACHVVAKVCEGLDYAHRKRDAMGRHLEIVHRDCSPQNVLVSFEGEVKLIDFGIAKAAMRSSRTMAGVLKGKFGYMSPEQVRGLPLDRRTDIFALGTILYESVVGARLFIGESDFSTLEKVRNVDITPPSELNANIPAEVEAVIMRALAKDPDDRYQWAGEMHADLIAYLTRQEFVFTAKQLARSIRSAFENEYQHERSLMEKYKQIGRNGLVAGVPQAEAKLDVVEHLGAAGEADDPTILGGPSFEDIIQEVGAQLQPRGQQAGNFGDEAPTELFGELGASNLVEYLGEASQILDQQQHQQAAAEDQATVLGLDAPDLAAARYAPPNGPPPPVNHASSSASNPTASAPLASAAAVAASARAPTAAPPAQQQHNYDHHNAAPPYAGNFNAPAGTPPQPAFTPAGSDPGSGYASPPDTMQFGSTADVNPLPTPSSVRALEVRDSRRRPSLLKDVAIGVGIAAAVLAVFAAGKYLFFGKSPGTREARATIAVLVQDKKAADVYLNDEKVGVVKGEKPFEIKDIPTGTHRVRVTRKGAKACERTVTLEAKSIREVNCAMVALPAAKATDDSQKSKPKVDVAATEVDAGVADAKKDVAKKDVAKKREAKKDEAKKDDSKKVQPNANTVHVHAEKHDTEAAERRRKLREKRRRERLRKLREERAKAKVDAKKNDKPKVTRGYFMAFTKPWARVYIDGRNTGKSTPIVPRAKIKLRPGKHKITFKANGKSFDFWITIHAGKDTKLIKDLPVN